MFFITYLTVSPAPAENDVIGLVPESSFARFVKVSAQKKAILPNIALLKSYFVNHFFLYAMEAIHRRRSMNVCYFNTYYCVFCKNFAHIFTIHGGMFYIESNLLCLPHLVFDLLIFACK